MAIGRGRALELRKFSLGTALNQGAALYRGTITRKLCFNMFEHVLRILELLFPPRRARRTCVESCWNHNGTIAAVTQRLENQEVDVRRSALKVFVGRNENPSGAWRCEDRRKRYKGVP